MKGSVWRWGDERSDLGVFVQVCVCVCVCVHACTYVHAYVCPQSFMLSFLPPAGSDPSSKSVLHPRHPRKDVPFAHGLECSFCLGAVLS